MAGYRVISHGDDSVVDLEGARRTNPNQGWKCHQCGIISGDWQRKTIVRCHCRQILSPREFRHPTIGTNQRAVVTDMVTGQSL